MRPFAFRRQLEFSPSTLHRITEQIIKAIQNSNLIAINVFFFALNTFKDATDSLRNNLRSGNNHLMALATHFHTLENLGLFGVSVCVF